MNKDASNARITECKITIMRSYDFNNFSIELTAEIATLLEVNDLRKEVQRLVDEAVRQYKTKERTGRDSSAECAILEREVRAIKENFPESEWRPDQKVKIHKWEDMARFHEYNYDDDDAPLYDDIPF